MKPIKFKPLFTKVYSFSIVNEKNEVIGGAIHELQFSNHASFCVKSTDPKTLAPLLETIAKQNKIDLMEYGQFEYAFDLLRYSVSWN